MAAARDSGPLEELSRLAGADQRAWRLCALFGGALSVGLAAAVLGEDDRTARGRMQRLAYASLLDRVPGGWEYRPPLRELAAGEADRAEAAGDRLAAVRRGLHWQLHGLATAAPHLAGRDDTPRGLPDLPSGVRAPEVDGYDAALAWTSAHWNFPVPVRTALAHGLHRIAWQLLAAGISAANIGSPLTGWGRAADDILEADRATGPGAAAGASTEDTSGAEERLDVEGRAWCHHARGIAAGTAGQPDRAVRDLRKALELRRELGGEHHRDLGWSALNTARWALEAGVSGAEVERLIEEGVVAHRCIGWSAGLVLARALRGALAERGGDVPTAVEHYEDALREPIGDPVITVWTSTALAAALLRAPVPDGARARQLAEAADRLAKRSGLLWGRISALVALADAAPGTAGAALRTAVELAATIGDPREAGLREALRT